MPLWVDLLLIAAAGATAVLAWLALTRDWQ